MPDPAGRDTSRRQERNTDEWDGRAAKGWHWLWRKGTASFCMAHYDPFDCWYVADRKGRTIRMHEPKAARLFRYAAPVPEPAKEGP